MISLQVIVSWEICSLEEMLEDEVGSKGMLGGIFERENV
jgi:hypothetical protein